MKKGRSLKNTRGTVWFSLLLLVLVQVVLNHDFWNWGEPSFYFGWMPGSYLYRLILIFLITPASLFLMIRLCWPGDGEEK